MTATDAGCVDWLATQADAGVVRFRIGRSGDLLVAEWPGVATLHATRDGSTYETRTAPGVEPAYAEKLVGGPIEALLRHLRGGMTLHASAVALGDVAVVCVGDSGAGKSTTAAALCDRACALVADDTVVVELIADRIALTPSPCVHWLPDEAVATWRRGALWKKPVAPTKMVEVPVRLAAVVALCPTRATTSIEIARLTGQRAFSTLTRALFRFAIDNADANARDFDRVARIVANVPVYELRRPHDARLIGAVADAIVSAVFPYEERVP